MSLILIVQDIFKTGTQQLLVWVTDYLPQIFLFLIFLNAVTRLIGRQRIERIASRCSSNAVLRYMVLPFLSAVILGNPMAISMGVYLPERCKPAYFASASYHCHTNSGIFHHINPAEFFIWLGIANGVLAQGLDLFPLAIRYLLAGLAANLLSGVATEIITMRLAIKQGIHLDDKVDLRLQSADDEPDSTEPADTSGGPLYRPVTITRGEGGYGGPVTVTPTRDRHVVLCMTGGGTEPEPLAKIIALSGMTAVNGNKETCPDDKVALAIIDCGGTLRCGIFPGKGIPTVNILPTGKSGPLAKYMTEDLYVSAVTSRQVSAAVPNSLVVPDNVSSAYVPDAAAPAPAPDTAAPVTVSPVPFSVSSRFLGPTVSVSRVIGIFHQSARDAVRICLEMLLPFMGFAALFIGICRGSGLTSLLAALLRPLGGSLPGFLLIGIICSVPGLSAVLGAGAVAAQMHSTLIGEMIASGSILPAMALPALFAINCQCACDFIPVGLSMTKAKPETIQVGIGAVTLSRFVTGWIRILIAFLFSIGLYR